MRKVLPPFLATAAILALAASTTLNLACGKKTPSQGFGRAPTTVPVVLRPVRVQTVQRTVDVVGTLYADEESVISAKVPGRIIKLYKDIGDAVESGEPLVQLKPNDYRLAVSKAQLAVEQALAKLGLSDLPSKDYDVSKVPTVERARLQAQNAQARFDRGKKLYQANPPLMSKQDFDDLETALMVAKSNYNVELLNAKALVAEAWALKGDRDIAEQRLSDATTRAPSPADPADLMDAPAAAKKGPTTRRTYVVTHRYVNEGELVREITPCYRLIDDSPIKLRAKVPEKYVAIVKEGQKVRANVEAYPGTDFWGTVSRVNRQIDADNRTFSIEVLIPNEDHRLKPGAFARAWVQTHMDSGVVFAPQEAIITFAGVNKVFTVDDKSRAVEINIEPGESRTSDSYVEIARGLKGQEQVVVSGASKLAIGVPVTVRVPTTQPVAAASSK